MNVPEGVQRDYPLARLTTVRTGGSGEFFARAGSEEQLLALGRLIETDHMTRVERLPDD